MLKRLTIEELNKIAVSRGGLLLSETYINQRQKLQWRCEKGHEWQACASSVKNNGSWCPVCAGRKRKTIEDMHEFARKHNGSCLSKIYKNKETKLRWRCEEGHEWEAKAGNIINGGNWCPICAGTKKFTIEDMHELARKHNGFCLSKTYSNRKQKLLWQCEEGHKWKTAAANVLANKWCPTCAGTEKLTIADMHRLAESRGGRFLSEEYVNSSTLHLWECADGHQWEAQPNNVAFGTWCPDCVKGEHISEAICRTTFQQIFKKQFPKKRPEWLKNQKGNIMELDGFCSSLKIAFEYNGEQHYQTNFFVKDAAALEFRKSSDDLKKDLCLRNNVFLVVISYKDNLTELPSLIERELSLKGFKLDGFDFNIEIDFNQVSHHRSQLEKLNQFAKNYDITLLSKKYLNSHTDLKWRCKEGHTWASTAANMFAKERRGQSNLCPVCNNSTRKSARGVDKENEIRKIVMSKGGKIIQMDYKNRLSRLKVKCKRGHSWEPKAASILEGHWCRTCANQTRASKNALTIEDMQQTAAEQGGKCLSATYTNAQKKLRWVCREGHIFEAAPKHVRNSGSWCPICYNIKRKAPPVSNEEL